ncbi:hypothetical protein BAUCODRAFT_35514 [Baudoinia panamericana UAMH 10762]|uniref:Uncharacterized protein n=1 Tax=Baudoinia panamericana (strain UAMH 10762) TaxID=717646 RepID=M2MCQ7_BAUPA|nr:uncharacterized protein BAUCODRAFT_35514 [Baudoinia panamericana UAMH 10762]EMC94326.1 hypothetical protein BAUCODRAFT_35514 [Baudoinia panamericana UAMH 10762]
MPKDQGKVRKGQAQIYTQDPPSPASSVKSTVRSSTKPVVHKPSGPVYIESSEGKGNGDYYR